MSTATRRRSAFQTETDTSADFNSIIQFPQTRTAPIGEDRTLTEEEPPADGDDASATPTPTSNEVANDIAFEIASPPGERPSQEPSQETGEPPTAIEKGEVEFDDPWAVRLPEGSKPSTGKAAFQNLLDGPLETVPFVLPEPVANAIQEYTLRLAIAGTPVSKQTLVAHALVFAYAHQDEWVGLVPGDCRRTGVPKDLTRGARKTTFRLPQKLNKATLRVLLRSMRGREGNAASRLSLVATALAYALNRADEWVGEAQGSPIR